MPRKPKSVQCSTCDHVFIQNERVYDYLINLNLGHVSPPYCGACYRRVLDQLIKEGA